ncbi:MAG: hypothetical protein ABF868_01880 [Sporolactobacillus sp.]
MDSEDRFNDDSLYDKQHAFHNEEYAKELAADQYRDEGATRDYPLRRVRDETQQGRASGWLALILSVAALFFLPLLLGIAGIVVGYFALRQGARTLGGWAIGIGLAAIFIQLLSPLFVR